ncbi:MAG: methyltransferase family protein [bacterium]
MEKEINNEILNQEKDNVNNDLRTKEKIIEKDFIKNFDDKNTNSEISNIDQNINNFKSSLDNKFKNTVAFIGFRYRALFPIPLVIIFLILAKANTLSIIVGTIFIILGAILRVICLGYLGVKSRGEEPLIANLITTGPYRYSRNPVYIANAAIAMGFAILATGEYGTLFSFLSAIFTILYYVLYYNYFVIPAEEEFLESKFKEKYIEYKKQVPKWLINFKPLENEYGRFRTLPIIKTEPWTWFFIILLYLLILLKSNIIKI